MHTSLCIISKMLIMYMKNAKHVYFANGRTRRKLVRKVNFPNIYKKGWLKI